MYSNEIEIPKAVITAIHHKVEDDKVQTRITVTGTLLPDLAERLGARDLIFAENGTPKGGFSSLALDTGCAAFRAIFEADPALKQSFELTSGDSTDQYTVTRLAECVMQLKLRLNYHGDPHRAVAYVMAIGNGDSRLRIVPLQTEIPAKDEPEEENDQERLFHPEVTRMPRTGRRAAQ
jgi:hypothetical protein